ncbi:hypothetical protein, partial [Baaleninema sp.]|uniref:hypothetical protein n=1 Tax=Baaleninema sp. TaxID=3101197 RepID=UPI003D060E15
MSNPNQNNSLVNKIVAPVVVALLVGGTSPWWWQEIFANNNAKNDANNNSGNSQNTEDSTETLSPSPTNEPGSETVLLKDEFLGKWSSEGDVRASHILEIEIDSINNNEISGILRSRHFDSGSHSG